MASRPAPRVALALLAVAACSCGAKTKDLPPVGQVLVIVDTDMPVPTFVGRLRVDLYTTDGRWYESRDLSRSKASDWPASFGVYLADPAVEQTTIVRLRGYPEGEVRDYRGERYAARPDPSIAPFAIASIGDSTNEPRLRRDDGSDVTPSSEPAPLLTIDRLVRVRVMPETRSAVRVVLRGSCVGTMADVARGRTCIDKENELVATSDEPTTADTTTPSASMAGSFSPSSKCTATPRPAGSPLLDEEVCVDGRMFILGTNRAFGLETRNDTPRRVAILLPFRMDRYEVTVARWRDALARGFSPKDPPVANEGPLATQSVNPEDPVVCTWSEAPRGREDHPMNCLVPRAARAFCMFLGGDLPTEAQWEYVAANAGRDHPTPFPWGGDANSLLPCERAIMSRGPFPFDNQCNPDAKQFGPLAVNARSGPDGDVSLGLGMVNMMGNMTELTSDSFASFSANCWAGQPLTNPRCIAPGYLASARGGSWYASSAFIGTRTPVGSDSSGTELGFRCVRPGT